MTRHLATNLRRAAATAIALCSTYQLMLGFYFIALRPPLLPEDQFFMHLTARDLDSLPQLAQWLDLVFTVLGGQMAALGAATAATAFRLYRTPLDSRELCLLAAAGVMSVGVMSGVNFALHSDFRWLLVLPALIWVVAIALGVLCLLEDRTRPATAATSDNG